MQVKITIKYFKDIYRLFTLASANGGWLHDNKIQLFPLLKDVRKYFSRH